MLLLTRFLHPTPALGEDLGYRSILNAAANNVRIIDSTNLASDDLDE